MVVTVNDCLKKKKINKLLVLLQGVKQAALTPCPALRKDVVPL